MTSYDIGVSLLHLGAGAGDIVNEAVRVYGEWLQRSDNWQSDQQARYYLGLFNGHFECLSRLLGFHAMDEELRDEAEECLYRWIFDRAKERLAVLEEV